MAGSFFTSPSHDMQNRSSLDDSGFGNDANYTQLLDFLVANGLVVDLPPPSQVHFPEIRVVSTVYFVLFTIGITGNSAVLTILVHLRRSFYRVKVAPENTLRYLTALSLADSLVMLIIPFAISDMMLGHWIFGNMMCKVYWTVESTGKILSTFFITAMSFDRYAGICFPHSHHLRSPVVANGLILILTVTALVVLSPLPLHAAAETIRQSEIIPADGRYVRFVTTKCQLVGMSTHTFRRFTWTVFGGGFVVPAALLLFFYGSILVAVRGLKGRCQSRVPLRRVAVGTAAIAGAYFVVWTPYWFFHLLYMAPLRSEEAARLRARASFVTAMYGVHGLPFLASALNWVLYAALNSQLRHAQARIANCRARQMSGSGIQMENPRCPTPNEHAVFPEQ